MASAKEIQNEKSREERSWERVDIVMVPFVCLTQHQSGSVLDGDNSPSNHSNTLLAETEAHTWGCLLSPRPQTSSDKNLHFFFSITAFCGHFSSHS